MGWVTVVVVYLIIEILCLFNVGENRKVILHDLCKASKLVTFQELHRVSISN